jgi:uncharacterized repeat protein (TIGR02543 family)
VVTLTAHPADGYRFDSWTIDGAYAGNASQRTLTIDADRDVVARFVKTTFELTLTAGSGGSIVASPQPVGGVYEAGTVVQLTASPLPGFQFSGWLLDTQPAGSDPTTTVLMDRDRAVRANFVSTASPAPSPSVTYPLTLTATAGGAAVAVPGAGPYAPNTRVALSATPAQGYVFTGWTIDGLPAGRANPYTITITAPLTVVANFAPAQVLNLSYTSGGRVDPVAATWDDGSPYPLGTVVTLNVTTASNGVFTGWTIDGAFAGWANPLTLTMDRPHTVVATFAARPRFGDLPPGPPPYEAIAQLAARGIVRGYQNGDFGANDTTLRADGGVDCPRDGLGSGEPAQSIQ